MRKSNRRAIRNKSHRTALKTAVHHVYNAKNVEEGKLALKNAISLIDRLKHKGILHPNAVARKKSRLTKRINVISSKTVNQ